MSVLARLTWKPGRLARNAAVFSAGLGLRTIAQAAVFLIVARVLGASGYGAYSAVLALAMGGGLLVGLGAGVVMVRDTARDPCVFARSWGRTLAALLVTAPLVLGVYLVLAWLWLPVGIGVAVVLCIGLAEILFVPLTQCAMQAYQGHERMGRAARILLAPVLPRTAAACLLPQLVPLVPLPPLSLWAVGYLVASVISVGYVLWLLRRDFNLCLDVCWRDLGHTLGDGWPCALAGVSNKIYVDIDKLMLARLAGLDAAGAYSAAYRVVDMAAVPLMSLLAASAARSFRVGQAGGWASLCYALQLLPVPLVYAGIVGGAFYLLSEGLPRLLGAEYSAATEALRWLAWLPLVNLPRLLLHRALICADRQRWSAGILLMGALSNVAINCWAIPLWDWRGAVGATYASELAMICLQVTAVGLVWKRGVRGVEMAGKIKELQT